MGSVGIHLSKNIEVPRWEEELLFFVLTPWMLFNELTCPFFNEFIESVFVEIPNDVFRMGKGIVIGAIYRPPGTDVSQCNIMLNEIISKIQKEGKIGYLLEDYNINLFNYEVHSPTAKFIDLMYSHSFVPLVNRQLVYLVSEQP